MCAMACLFLNTTCTGTPHVMVCGGQDTASAFCPPSTSFEMLAWEALGIPVSARSHLSHNRTLGLQMHIILLAGI